MTANEIIKHIIKKKGRWGTMHFELDFEKGDYQHPTKISGNSFEDVFKKACIKYLPSPPGLRGEEKTR